MMNKLLKTPKELTNIAKIIIIMNKHKRAEAIVEERGWYEKFESVTGCLFGGKHYFHMFIRIWV